MGSLFAKNKATAQGSIHDCPSKGMQFTMNFVSSQYPDVCQASTTEVFEKMQANEDDSNLIILDIREEEEFNVSHIPTAKWISPKASAQEIIDELKIDANDADIGIYCYCSVGYRSSITARKLQNYGIKNVYNIQGSIFKWVNEGKPIVDNEGNDGERVHTFIIFLITVVLCKA